LLQRSLLLSLAVLAPRLVAGDPNATDAGQWPPPDEAPVFVFKNAFEPVVAHRIGEAQPIFNYELQASGFARPRSSGALDLAHGHYLAPAQGAFLADVIAAKGTLALELFIKPATAGSTGEILRLGASRAPALVLSQRDGQLHLHANATPVTELSTPLPLGSGSHVFVHYGDDRLTLYLDGSQVAEAGLHGHLAGLQKGELVLGSGTPEEPGWSGQLEGLAIYRDLPGPRAPHAHAEIYRHVVNLRPPVPHIRLKAQLIDRSHLATLREIAPYRESLAVFEYKVLGVLEGAYLAEKIRIAHYVLLDARNLPVRERAPGSVVTLAVEPFEANRQLKNVHLSDTLAIDFDLDLYFDTGHPY
jgi:hypothetical protein